MDELRLTRINRRTFNRFVLGTAAALPALQLLAACGSDDDDDDGGSTAEPGSSAQPSATTAGGATSSTPTGAEPTPTSEAAADTPTTANSGESGLEKVIVAVGADVATLDPINEPTTNFSHLRQSFENLVLIDANLEPQPALAVSWEMVDDTTWDFTLREGVKFHNDEPMTSEDVAWSLTTMLGAGAESGPRKAYVAWLESVEAVDELTVRLKTLGPYPAVISSSYIPLVIPKAHFEAVGAEGFNEDPIGTGPYRITSWSLNQQLELEKFDDYWGEPAIIPQAAFRIIPEESTRINEVVTGGAHVVLNLSPSRVAELQDNSDVTLTSKPSVLNFYLGFNTLVAPFDNLKVRQAIAYALDVPLMIQELLGGYGQHANSLVHSTSFGWHPDLPVLEYDPERAMALLTEAGFEDGFSAEFQGGPTVWPVTKETGEAVSGFLSEIGIDAPFALLEWGDFFDRYRNAELQGIFLWGNSSPGLDAQQHLNLNFHSPPVGRGLYWSSPEVDALLDAAQTDLDADSRLATFQEVQQIFHDEMVAVPLWQYEEVAAINNAIEWQARGDFYIQIAEVKPK